MIYLHCSWLRREKCWPVLHITCSVRVSLMWSMFKQPLWNSMMIFMVFPRIHGISRNDFFRCPHFDSCQRLQKILQRSHFVASIYISQGYRISRRFPIDFPEVSIDFPGFQWISHRFLHGFLPWAAPRRATTSSQLSDERTPQGAA